MLIFPYLLPILTFFLITLFFGVVLTWLKTHPSKKTRLLIYSGTGVFIFFLIIWTDITLIEAQPTNIIPSTISIQHLEYPLRIALVSDLHLGHFIQEIGVKRTVKKIIESKPDIVFIVGDFFFYDDVDIFDSYLKPLSTLAKIIPTYAVLGNHDYGIKSFNPYDVYKDEHKKIEKLISETGVHILANQSETISIKDQNIHLIGFNELWVNRRSTEPLAVPLTFADNFPRLVLTHNPDLIYDLPSGIVDLVLAGHTHGGQVRLPFVGPLGDAYTRLPRSAYQGLSEWNGNKLFVTAGVGMSGLPIRFFDPSRVDLITLKPAI